jgi:hypothetical protein
LQQKNVVVLSKLEQHLQQMIQDEKKHVADLMKRHVAPRHILLSLKEQNPHCVTHINQIYKNKVMQQKEERGFRIEMQQLLQLLDDANYVSWSRRSKKR